MSDHSRRQKAAHKDGVPCVLDDYVPPWMASDDYLKMLAQEFRRHHQFPEIERFPSSRLIVNLLSENWLFEKTGPSPLRQPKGENMHMELITPLEARWRVQVAERFTAIQDFIGLGGKEFGGKYKLFTSGPGKDPKFRNATLSGIRKSGNGVAVEWAKTIAKGLGFHYHWFIWPSFHRSPSEGSLLREARVSLLKRGRDVAIPVFTGKKRLSEVMASINWPSCPRWVDPFMLAVVLGSVENQTYGLDRTALPIPDGIKNLMWHDILRSIAPYTGKDDAEK